MQQINQQLNCCSFCGKWFGAWKITMYEDQTVQKQCPYCLSYPLCNQDNEQVK